MQKNYNIGLDIGTTSVGWAVVESDTQKIIRKGKGKKRKALWGVRLFEEASTAETRRGFRSTRRRYDRRRNRIKLLQEEFEKEINKVDNLFYKKMRESKYNENDKLNKTILLSSEEKKLIRNYNKEYKTIYHLRNRLICDDSQADIRLVYLALHHIIKYRGNFLYTMDNFNVNNLNLNDKLEEVFESLLNNVPALGISENYKNFINIEEISKNLMAPSKNDIKVYLKELLKDISACDKFGTEFGKLVVGNKFSIKELFVLEDIDKLTMSFDSTEYEDKYEEYENILGDKIETLDLLKQLYDTIFLKKLFKGNNNINISALMVEKYNQHKDNLDLLKELFRLDRKKYNIIFRSIPARKKDNNHEEKKEYICYYERYIHNKLSFEDFSKELNKYIPDLLELANNSLLDKWNLVKEKYANGNFLPRITDSDNGKYPYQLNKDELIKIIENQGKYYPFLLDKTNGKYKIVTLLEFKIPYYIGPLVSEKQSEFAWMEKKVSNVKITPYNFDEVVDKELTAEKFIKRMISRCTYLLNEYALPNNSILYSRYKVINELKQIKVNGNKIPNNIQHKILEEYFMKTSGIITDSKFKMYLRTLPEFGMYENDINITGYSSDNKFANNMQSYVDFFSEDGIFSFTSYNEEDADKIIEWITIFEDKDILENKVRREYPELNDSSMKKILNKKYAGWGNLSKKLLCNLYYNDKKTGINKSILDLMYETEENFMQIVNNDEYKYQELIKKENIVNDIKIINYDLVSGLATSPATKKGIYQALKVVDEIIKYIGYEPDNIMIEMARNEEKKERKDDRKKYLSKLYNEFKLQINNYNQLNQELDKYDQIDSTKLFLYFIQEGKCLYTGTPLNIEDLNSYEIDHIIPRTLIKDDSIDNKALVLRECNQTKKANFVLPREYNNSINKTWWQHLKKIGLMSAKKFHNLIRTEYSDEDIQGFINRQLVETRQITKHVANILNSFYKKTNIVYLKANLSHNYRERYELFKFRQINDYHHAHDAYLAAVLGEYKEKYMTKNLNYELIKELNYRIKDSGNYKKFNYGYVINSLDSEINDCIYELSKNMIDKDTGELVFDSENFNKIVEDTLYRNDILISRKTEVRSGQFFKQTIYPANIGNVRLKSNMPTELYGGYSNVETSYLCLVKFKNKVKLIGIPLQIAVTEKQNKNIKLNYIMEHLNVEDFEILKDRIPFESLYIHKGQTVYIKGYSIAHKNCEISNARQLKLSSEKQKEWKNTLNKILNKSVKTVEINESDINIAYDIIQYLYDISKDFPLFEKDILKIKENINLSACSFEQLSKIIVELLKIYHCNSENGNLKEFGLGDRIGRLSGINIDNNLFKNVSVTGIWTN